MGIGVEAARRSTCSPSEPVCPLSSGISGANLHDSQALEPLVRGIPPVCMATGRRRHRRCERRADRFAAFTSIARTLACYRRLTGRDELIADETTAEAAQRNSA
ncbi:hypothetical protein GCM10009753_45630 [Streptantibioticus ferralitis]